MSFQLTELARRLDNLIRIGTIVEADYQAARVRVQSADLVTDWLPWLTWRAAHDVDWWAPEVGERVLLLCLSGDPAAGVVLPAAYHTERPAPAASADKRVILFHDGTSFEYDRAESVWRVSLVGDAVFQINGNLTATVNGDTVLTTDSLTATVNKNAAISAGGEVTVDAAKIRCNGGTGVVTGESICHFTGRPHGDISTTVTAGK